MLPASGLVFLCAGKRLFTGVKFCSSAGGVVFGDGIEVVHWMPAEKNSLPLRQEGACFRAEREVRWKVRGWLRGRLRCGSILHAVVRPRTDDPLLTRPLRTGRRGPYMAAQAFQLLD